MGLIPFLSPFRLSNRMDRNATTRRSFSDSFSDMMSSIPTLGDSITFTASKDEKTSNKPAPRDIKIQSKLKNSLKIDFDVGLLMNSIPNRDDIDEDIVAWDWEQQFSQLA